jgi:pimeloyl-ACP methyl ester carboxylesterase
MTSTTTGNGLPDLETAQRSLLESLRLRATVRPLPWSGGATQVVEAGSGSPLFFVHGGFGQMTEFLPLWPQLVDRFRLLAVDRPGHGLADPYDFRGVDTVALGATFLREALDALELERAVLVANSMGGRWALELALRDPRRVERLILVGAPAGSCAKLPLPLLALRWPLARTVMDRIFRDAEPDGVREFFGKILVAQPERLSDELLVATAAGQRRQHASMLSFASRVIGYRSINPALVIGDAWKRLEVPVHLVWGDADAFDPPSSGEAIAARLPAGGELTVIPGAGHLAWLDEPEAVTRAIERALG